MWRNNIVDVVSKTSMCCDAEMSAGVSVLSQ